MEVKTMYRTCMSLDLKDCIQDMVQFMDFGVLVLVF